MYALSRGVFPGCAQAQERKGKGKRRASGASALPDPEAEPERFAGGLSGIEVLLDLLGKSLCARSAGHLETALHLIEARLHASLCMHYPCVAHWPQHARGPELNKKVAGFC